MKTKPVKYVIRLEIVVQETENKITPHLHLKILPEFL